MEVKYPYIYTSPRVFVQEEAGFDNENGVTYQEAGGEHAIWAAKVPFLPAMISEDFTRLGVKRIALIQYRQFHFIYDLVRAREHRATFELRFISTPNPVEGQPNLIDIVFLGKVFSKRLRGGQPLAEQLWEKFSSTFPVEDPFGYPLQPVSDEAEFRRFYEPFSLDDLQPEQVMEIRKYEDMPVRSMAPLGRVERKGDYIAHPFVPSEDFNPMSRFFVALASQPQKCYAGVSIRPTRMFDQEVYNVSFIIGQFKKTASEDDDVTEEYIRTRSKIGIYVYKKMMQAREQLVMVRVHLAGEHEAPRGLAEALGSEMMGNADSVYPTMWSAAQPSDEREMASALNNLRYLEQEMWGHTIAPAPLARLRYFATAEEVYGAFRLPVPPESGYLPGVLVKNEPFVAPMDELELRARAQANLNNVQEESRREATEKKVDLGMVYHRGNGTPGDFQINIADLTRHMLIAGSTGSGKSTTIKHILSQLWIKHRIPFLVLYPLNKTDYRDLLGFKELKDDMLLFTLGDETTSSFRFNPFEVPEGLLLKTHLSRLMRVFTAAFSLFDPLPMIYREALRRVYRSKGWDTVLEKGNPGREYPIMSDFYQAIKEITDGLQYGREVKDNVRQASVIRIADLLENAGHTINVQHSMNLDIVLNRPTVMEIGRVGSTEDTTLLMGFLLMRFAEEVECHPRPKELPHITVVEEAHRLMAETSPNLGQTGNSRSAAGEDFANILAEVRGYGEGMLIAEQIPTLLVKGAIGNTYLKIMHWLEDAPSFDLFCNIMNLKDTQRDYARTLTPGFGIVRNPYGRPVHIKVPEFGDQPGYIQLQPEALSDECIHDWMQAQKLKFGMQDVHVVEWNAHLLASAGSEEKGLWTLPVQAQEWVSRMPIQSCLYCKPFNLEAYACPYSQRVRTRLQKDEIFRKEALSSLEAALNSADLKPAAAHLGTSLIQTVGGRMAGLTVDQIRGVVYCFLAHEVDALIHQKRETEHAAFYRTKGRALLRHFYEDHQ